MPARRTLILLAVAAASIAVLFIAALPRTSDVTGVVVGVDSASLTNVRGFTLRTDSGETVAFRIGALDLRPPGFNAQHLVSHVATGLPIVVTYATENGDRVAQRMVDAAPQSAGGT